MGSEDTEYPQDQVGEGCPIDQLAGYHGPKAAVAAVPRIPLDRFTCFWPTATGWGSFSTGPGSRVVFRFAEPLMLAEGSVPRLNFHV
jgi:hypothetical protein